MANPTRPKDAKPNINSDDFEIKTTGQITTTKGGNSILATIGIVAIAAIVIIVTNYFFVDMKISQVTKKINDISATTEESMPDSGEGVAAERGIILDLGEFILNLADTNSRKFLKVNVAVELSKKSTDTDNVKKNDKQDKKEELSAVEAEMNQYKPSIRDSVISVLSAKTSEELSTTPGKELAKEQIKGAIDAIFEGDREVLRVSFGSFFIQ